MVSASLNIEAHATIDEVNVVCVVVIRVRICILTTRPIDIGRKAQQLTKILIKCM